MSPKDGESGGWSLLLSGQGLGLFDKCGGLFCGGKMYFDSTLFNVYIIIEGLFPNNGHQEDPKCLFL